MSALSHIVAQETQDGRLIVRFLAAAMNGQLADFQPCHRLDAARLLVKLGFEPAQPSPPLVSLPNHRTDPAPRPHPVNRRSPPEPSASDHHIRSELAQIVREETDDGYIAVRFLVNVMQGELPDFKPCHRLSAAKELLHRGFDCSPDEPDPYDDVHAPAEPDPDPADVEARRQLQEDIDFSRHGPVYYATYPYPCVCEDCLHDCKGNELSPEECEKAAHHIPAKALFINGRDVAEKQSFMARYAEYVNRRNALNPDNPIDFNCVRWPPHWHPPGPDP